MKELIESIKPLVEEELKRANEKFTQFIDAHHGYAIIKEEYEEAQAELNSIGTELWSLWSGIKNNDNSDLIEDADLLKINAINLAAEAIQTAAMAQKFLDMLERMEKERCEINQVIENCQECGFCEEREDK